MGEWITYRRRRKASVGDTFIGQDGYCWMKVSDKPPRWMLAHRWAMEQKLGRTLLPSEHVHHVCHDRPCFEQDHLELIAPGDHSRHHQLGRKQSGEWVQSRLSAARRYWAKPENRTAHGDKMRALWGDPAYRAKLKIGRKAGWKRRKASGKPHNSIGRKDSPEVRAKRAESLRRYWTEHRDRAVELAKKRWTNPETVEKQRVAQRAMWARRRGLAE